MRSDSHRNYGNAVAEIYRDLGRAQAEARLQRGQVWSNAINQVGQAVGAIPGMMEAQRQQQRRDALTDLQMQEVKANLERAKAQDAHNMALAELISGATVNGVFDKNAFAESAAARGMGQIVPEVIKTFAESERALIDLENAKKAGQLTDAKLAELQQAYLRPYAIQLWETKFDPMVVNGAFAALRAQGVPEELVRQWEAMPAEQMSLMVQGLLPSRPAPEAFTLSEGQVRMTPQTDQYGRPMMGADGQPVMTRTEGVAKPRTLEEQLADAVARKDGAEVARIRGEMARTAAANRAPQQAPQPQYQRIETVDAAGNPVIQFMTPEEVRQQGGVKTSPKTTAKASGPAAVDAILGEITALSERINTSRGGPGANLSGAARRGAAALNMDNEVSEYQALVEGFIPMVARAVGHTSVLTQQDVDSVRALFPQVGDNQALAQSKLARVRRILSAMQEPGAAPAGTTLSERLNAVSGGGGAAAPALSAEELIKKYGGR